MLMTLKTTAVDGAVVTFRRQLCDKRATAQMLLRTARAEFPGGEHWLQMIEFQPSS